MSLEPIDPAVAVTWAERFTGPPESRVVPESALLAFVVRWLPKRHRWRGYFRATALRLFSGAEVRYRTNWGVLAANRRSHTLLRGVFSEPLECAVVARLIKPGMTIVDVGANFGWYTLLAASIVGPSGRVIALEPDPRPRKELARNIQLNPQFHNIEIVPKAASDVSGTVSFAMPKASALSHIRTDDEQSFIAAPNIATVTLTELFRELQLGSVDFIKIDIEGAEPMALRGLAEELASGRSRPSLLVEVEARWLRRFGFEPSDVTSILGDGYRCLWLCWRHGMPEPFPNIHCDSGRNVLCLPAESADDTLGRIFGPVRPTWT